MGEILFITRDHFDTPIQSSFDLKSIYADILEEYNALHIKLFGALNIFDIDNKISPSKTRVPSLINKLSNVLLV